MNKHFVAKSENNPSGFKNGEFEPYWFMAAETWDEVLYYTPVNEIITYVKHFDNESDAQALVDMLNAEFHRKAF